MKTIKVIVADDHKLVANGLIALLQPIPTIEVVGTAANGLEVLQLLEKRSADVVLLDISMPEMDGLETTEQIKKRYPGVRVLVLTTNDEGSIIASLFERGADGYLLKNVSNQELIQGIETAHRGQRVLSVELSHKLIDGLQRDKNRVPRLTKRERQVLALIADECTLNDIAAQLSLSVNTVVTHKRNLFTKLATNTSVGLVRRAIQLGLLEA